MTYVLVWSDSQGPQQAWVVTATPDPDAPVPEAAWTEGGPWLGPQTVVASKGSQSWRNWAEILTLNSNPVGGAFSLLTAPDTVNTPQLALRFAQNRAMLTGLGAGSAPA